MRSKNNVKAIVALISLYSMTSLSAENLILDENAFLIDIPTVTSATRLTQHLSDAPVSMTVIDRATIQASGAQNLPDIFRLVPGFQVAHVNTNKYAVTYHGHSDDFPRRLEVMVDGRSVYMPLISSPDWTSLGLHIDDIEKIEIVRGSNTATHGSNAFLGAINIITRHPSTEGTLSASGSLGSLGTHNGNFRVSSSNSFGYFRISGGHEQNEGSIMFNDGAQRNYINFSGSFAPTLHDQVNVWLGIDDGYIRIGELKPARGRPEDLYVPERGYQSHYQHIHWERAIYDHLQFGIKAYQNTLQLEEQTPNITDLIEIGLNEQLAITLLANNPHYKHLNEDGNSQTRDLELFINQNNTSIQSYTALGIRENKAESQTLFDQGKVESLRYRIFNNTSLKPNNTYTINLGISLEKEESKASATSIRGGINYHFNEDTTFRLGYSYSERLASLFESSSSTTIFANRNKNIIYDAIRRPNNNLNPERINSFEIGTLYQFNDNNGHFDLRIFNDSISNGIETYKKTFPIKQIDGTETTRVERNISRWNNRGAELQIKIKPSDALWLLINYAYINSTKELYYDDESDPESVVLRSDPLAPQHTVSAVINWKPLADLNISAAHYYVDQMHWFGGDTKEAYNRTDLRVAKNWTPSSQTQAEAALVVQNAFGPTYKEFYDYHDFERRIFLNFRLKYN